MLPNKKWSRMFDACIECGTTKIKHIAHGLCRKCNRHKYRKTAKGKAEQKRYFDIYRKTERGKNKLYSQKLKEAFGITIEDKILMLESQRWVCAICGRHVYNTIREWHVDHDHKTKKVRGILCSKCNQGLGYFKDNIVLLQSAIEYLQKS